LLKQKKKKP